MIDDQARGRPQAIVLAAGAATRFGGGKLLASFRDRPLLAWALEAAWAAPVGGVTMVTGCDSEAIGACASAAAHGRAFDLVHARDWREGLSASLRRGLAAVPIHATCALIYLGDMPLIPAGLASRLIAALGRADAAVPAFDGRPGHPVLLARTLFDRVATLAGDRGAGALLDSPDVEVVRVPVADPGATFDVDLAEHLTEPVRR